MASVGLLYVGAVLILNGLMLLGRVDARAAAPLNFFVGGLQVITPTWLIFTSGGDPDTVLAASGLYLFGFTYLYVGFNLLGGLDGTGLGWFSAFVAGCAVVYAGLNFGRLDDPAFGVIWLYWAVLWALFWVVLGLKREEWTRFTGLVAVVAGVFTAAIPAFLLLTGVWDDYLTASAIALAVICLASLALAPRMRVPQPAEVRAPAPEFREADAPPSPRSGT
ncbi:transporter, partial [Blastococcus sp. KM273128]|uniref:AmiS/UreI family transporter n=1 Tax=Blastococcus sp. KM273128 TaxID=2570314 RepID=UPI001F1F01A7